VGIALVCSAILIGVELCDNGVDRGEVDVLELESVVGSCMKNSERLELDWIEISAVVL